MDDGDQKIPEKVELNNLFFKPFDNPHFRISRANDGKSVFAGNLGDQEVELPLSGIARELGIEEGSEEETMFKSIEKGLRYVTMLRFGDPMPAELLTGRASWAVEDRHVEMPATG